MTPELGPSGSDDAAFDAESMANAVRAAFSPAAPINHRDLFAGRTNQMFAVLDSLYERGRHVAVYGERGVGKTSLATVIGSIAEKDHLVARANCIATDTASRIIERLLSKIRIDRSTQQPGFAGQNVNESSTASQVFFGGNADVQHDDIRFALDQLAAHRPLLLIIDEFDRVENRQVHHDLADLIKALSDDSAPVTLVLVGVADSVTDLITEHLSVERNLKQVQMPRMSRAELVDAINLGCAKAGITMTDQAKHRVARLSQGLPTYTHLVAQQAGLAAVYGGDFEVSIEHVDAAIVSALTNVQESVEQAYHKGTFSAQANLYKQVMLACACAQGDDRGFFTAAAVREPLSLIMGKPYNIPAFAPHLNSLSDGVRGNVLRKEGVKKRFGYRFSNPLLQPYVIMRGLADGLITQDEVEQLQGG